ncbi:MAG: glycosyltransferase, partial [bacterium]|nr:glycosyltransferase [bacterium]
MDIDPSDPLQLKNPIVARGAALYYAEQADLNAEALRREIWAHTAEVEQARKEADQKMEAFKTKLTPKHLPKTLAKRVYNIANKKTHGRLNGLRYGGWSGLTGRPKRTGPAIPRFTDIKFTLPDKPVVSVVVPVFNLLDITVECLRSLTKIKESVSFEVIVVDDASTEPLVQPVLHRIPGIVYVRQPKNGGFVNSCNSGALKARGEFIYFLNNDTTVHDSFLSPVVELYKNPHIGAVGSKLVHPTGLLQEAGGIVFKTGEGWNYGKSDRPDRPEYNVVRDVDYCSGAGLSIRRSLFERIGGFNKNLEPGYYEDVELCFAVRELGYRVVYQPHSVVVHYEGASSLSNVVDGKKPMKAYQEVNYHKFKKMRAAELADQWPKELLYLPLIARRKRGLRVWVFDWFVPMHDREYGAARMLTILELLARDHTVTFVARDIVDRERYRVKLQDIGVYVCPRIFGSNFTNTMRAEGKFIDLAIVSRPEIMHFFYHVIRRFAPQAPIIYDTVDVHHVRLERELAKTTATTGPAKIADLKKQIEYFRTLEREYGTLADVVWAITPTDQQNFRRLLPSAQIDIVSGAHEPHKVVPGVSGRTGLLYIGSFHHPPNISAVEFYIQEIYPRLQKRLPGVQLKVIGHAASDQLKQLAGEKTGGGVVFLGGVDDATLLAEQKKARIFVCPLLFGSGLKGKIVMSMAAGLPVVTTSVGAEGIPAQNGHDIAIADSPDDFVARIVELYLNAALWQERSRNGQQVIEDHYSERNLQQELRTS